MSSKEIISREKIVKKFPDLVLYLSCWDCEDGWNGIIFDFLEILSGILKNKEDDDETMLPCCFKEKYGTLRIYMTSTMDILDDLIDDASTSSEHTCEECGEDGVWFQEHGWYYVRCEECWGEHIPQHSKIRSS